MKKVLRNFTVIFLMLCGTACVSSAQKTELRANVYSGLFFFRGTAATSNSSVLINDVFGYYNPASYGKLSDFSYAFELQLQRVTRNNHVLGIGVAFESLKSRANSDSLYGDFSNAMHIDGKVTLRNKYVTVNPYIGQRLQMGKVSVDLLAGIDFAFSINVKEEAVIKSPQEQQYTLTKENHPVDYRPRIQVNAYINRMGFLAGYSLGLENLYFYDNPFYYDKKAYANFLRFGISYRL